MSKKRMDELGELITPTMRQTHSILLSRDVFFAFLDDEYEARLAAYEEKKRTGQDPFNVLREPIQFDRRLPSSIFSVPVIVADKDGLLELIPNEVNPLPFDDLDGDYLVEKCGGIEYRRERI